MDGDEKDKGYGLVERSVLRDTTLSSRAKLVYCYLCSFAGNADECYPTREIMGHELGMGRTNITTTIGELKRKGLISIRYTKNDNGRFSNSIYQIKRYGSLADAKKPTDGFTACGFTDDGFTVYGSTDDGEEYTNSNSYNNNSINNNSYNNNRLNSKRHNKNRFNKNNNIFLDILEGKKGNEYYRNA